MATNRLTLGCRKTPSLVISTALGLAQPSGSRSTDNYLGYISYKQGLTYTCSRSYIHPSYTPVMVKSGTSHVKVTAKFLRILLEEPHKGNYVLNMSSYGNTISCAALSRSTVAPSYKHTLTQRRALCRCYAKSFAHLFR